MAVSSPLYPFQTQGVEFLHAHHYSILGDSMGLGKTRQALELARRTNSKTLVICPAYLKQTWKREAKKWAPEVDLTVETYSQLTKLPLDIFETQLVIADEAHYLKNLKAQRTSRFHDGIWEHLPPRLVLLTGTPIKNRVTEWYSLLLLMSYTKERGTNTNGLNINSYCANQWEFNQMFSIEKITPWATVFEGHRNVPLLKKILKGKYLRRKAEEVLDLPEFIRKDIVHSPNKRDKELLDQFMEGKSGHFSTVKMSHAEFKVGHTVRYVKDLIEQGEGPVVVFSDHPTAAKALASFFKRSNVITGATPGEDRHHIIDAFQDGRLDVLVGTIGAMSTGFTLTNASNLVFNDLSWVPGDIAQAEKRIHRIGQDKPCTVHRILFGDTDIKIAETLTAKVKTLEACT